MGFTVLAVAPKREWLDLLGPLLCRRAFELHEMPTASASLILTHRQRYDLLLVGYPLPDMRLEQFLSAVRGLDSPCADSPVLILGEPKRLAETEELVERGYVQAVATDEGSGAVVAAASRLLEVPPRVGVRAMVRLDVDIERGRTVQLAQTRNVSEDGMFIATSRDLALGEQIPVQLYLPDEAQPITAEVEVQRQALPEVEGFEGVGVRFVSVTRGGRLRLRRHLESQAA